MDDASSSRRHGRREHGIGLNLRKRTTSRSGPPVHQLLPPPPPSGHPHPHRKRTHHHQPHPAQQAKQPRKESDIVDRIWHDIDEEQREKQAKKMAEAAEEARKAVHHPPVTSGNKSVELTINNLKNFCNEDDTVNE
uniref:Uncharacterized protein n=1 Tax=Caenorhabditis japonica TaxID=281687 RepID=A0A8R1DXB1_CAEJA